MFLRRGGSNRQCFSINIHIENDCCRCSADTVCGFFSQHAVTDQTTTHWAQVLAITRRLLEKYHSQSEDEFSQLSLWLLSHLLWRPLLGGLSLSATRDCQCPCRVNDAHLSYATCALRGDTSLLWDCTCGQPLHCLD